MSDKLRTCRTCSNMRKVSTLTCRCGKVQQRKLLRTKFLRTRRTSSKVSRAQACPFTGQCLDATGLKLVLKIV